MDDPGSRTPTAGRRNVLATARRRLSRPHDIVGGTRWLFWLVAMISLLMSMPPTLRSAHGGVLVMAGILSALAFAASCTAGYLLRRTHWLWDIGDSLLLLALASLAPAPPVVMAFVMSLIWFRSLYGSPRATLVRCCFFAAVLPLSVLTWAQVPGHVGALNVIAIGIVLPTMFLTTIAGRQLGAILTERQDAAGRDAIQAAAGAELLGVTAPDEIMRIAAQTVAGLCAVTPGLRVLTLVSDTGDLRVTGNAGGFVEVPTTLPGSVVGTPAHDGSADLDVSVLARLDAAAGERCTWRSASLTGQRDGAWLVIGSRARVPAQAVDTLSSFVMHVILAMRNSAAHQSLTVQATMDNLTGLANRSLFNLSLGSALTKSAGSLPVMDTAVLFVDLDDFKNVNDGLGHAAGDETLREVAARLRAATRSQDLCARLGGDEFAVLLYRTGADTATAIARRIVHAVSEPMQLSDGVARVGASIGVAVCDGAMTPEQLVQHADIAMYAAKAAGKGRVQLYADGLLRDDDDDVVVFDRQLMAAAAIQQLVVLYQPIVSLADGRCSAVEALVRWNHPTRGLLEPVDFIGAAERTGAIRDLGMYVLRRACADAADWRRSRPGPHVRIHVDVSAVQLDSDFCTRVLRCLEEFSIPPTDLVLEIAETVVLVSPSVVNQLDVLARHGIVIAIDAFGTGDAALTTLRSLPVTIVKIDASFVAGSTASQEDRAVVEAIVQMANRLGIRTIAEGVERLDQQALLESVGATASQGSLHLRPSPSGELCGWLDERPLGEPTPSGVVVRFPDRRGSTAV